MGVRERWRGSAGLLGGSALGSQRYAHGFFYPTAICSRNGTDQTQFGLKMLKHEVSILSQKSDGVGGRNRGFNRVFTVPFVTLLESIT